MKILILSDLHTEFVGQCWALPEELPDFDVCVLAGDIAGSPAKGVDFAATAPALAGKPIVYVPGNHEFYGGEIENRLRVGKEAAQGTNVRLLDRDVVAIGGVRFVGAIAWTDYRLFGNQPLAMAHAARGLNDHVRIERRGPRGSLRFLPSDALARHLEDRAFIEETLAAPFDGATVVVTHHAPHPGSVAPRFANDPLTPAFVSDLGAVIDRFQPALWIHGHTHGCFDYRVGETRIVCNPEGYGPMRPGKPLENAEFGMKVVEV
ncbi:MAG: metallophosphoesterase [Methylocystaceae bacterium]|nr:MAG: metallophosphoesterase [Methylocystaceae bacterium]